MVLCQSRDWRRVLPAWPLGRWSRSLRQGKPALWGEQLRSTAGSSAGLMLSRPVPDKNFSADGTDKIRWNMSPHAKAIGVGIIQAHCSSSPPMMATSSRCRWAEDDDHVMLPHWRWRPLFIVLSSVHQRVPKERGTKWRTCAVRRMRSIASV